MTGVEPVEELRSHIEVEGVRLFTNSIDYLDHATRSRRLNNVSHITDAFKRFKPPKNVTELRSFFDLCNVFRRFLPNFARVATLHERKLRKGQPKKFTALTAEDRAAMKELQNRFHLPPVVALSYADRPFTQDTNAYNVQVEYVLLQDQPNKSTRPVG